MNSWCLWFLAKLNKTAVYMLFFDIRGTQSPHTLPYRCLALFAGFLLIKVQKVFLILIALSQEQQLIIVFTVNPFTVVIEIWHYKGEIFTEGHHYKLTSLHACGHFGLFLLIISIWLQFACNLFTACINIILVQRQPILPRNISKMLRDKSFDLEQSLEQFIKLLKLKERV